jgi:uncharacterized protein YraI
MKFKALMLLIIPLLSLLMFQPAAARQPTWTADYFANPNLSGTPVRSLLEADPSHDWGTGAPLPGLPADGFSVRWTNTRTWTEGLYEFSVFVDDGVRILVDGELIINEFHPAPGRAYTSELYISMGTHTVVVEYYEAGGHAYIDYDVTLLEEGTEAPPPLQAAATVTANTLNVRNAPSATTGTILTQIGFGETYPVVGRNAEGTWWQIQIDGITGWVNGQWVDTFNVGGVPVTGGAFYGDPVDTGYVVFTDGNLNIRNGPAVTYARIGWLPINRTAAVIGRNADNSWWHIRYGNVTGWVSSLYADLQPGADVTSIPITTGTVPEDQPLQTGYTAVTNVNLNVRSGPGTNFPIVGLLYAGQTANVIGRNASSTWWQIQRLNLRGWVSATYAQLEAGANLIDIPATAP